MILLMVMAAAQVASALALWQMAGRLSDRDVRRQDGPHVPWLLPSSWGGYLHRIASALEGADAELARLADDLGGPVRAERARARDGGRRCCSGGGDTFDDYDDARREGGRGGGSE